jgi:hypothetical protein
MKKQSVLSLALLIGCMAATSMQTTFSQNSKVDWSSVSSGFGLQASATSRAGSSVGEGIVGGSRLVNTAIEGGFIAGLVFRGVGAAVHEPSAGLPVSFSLSQNYPNPFNPSTVIRFQVPAASHVRLTVFDILGREVNVLVNEQKTPGTYEVKFSANGGSASGGGASSLASGVYFYRMQAGDFVDTKKFLLLK